MKICAVIPSFNHYEKLEPITSHLKNIGLAVILVDDASTAPYADKLAELAKKDDNISLVVHKKNKGKGGAVMTGLLQAGKAGYSHALQIDADGQHNMDDIATALSLAKDNPGALISGRPVYDESIPKSRLIGREITHFWVKIETLSWQTKDTMCGFRVYPLAETCQLLEQVKLGERMDYDIEVMVRLDWRNVPILFFPTHVKYPEDGKSHFRALEDNVLISWLHTRLVFGMLIRLPFLLWNKLKR